MDQYIQTRYKCIEQMQTETYKQINRIDKIDQWVIGQMGGWLDEWMDERKERNTFLGLSTKKPNNKDQLSSNDYLQQPGCDWEVPFLTETNQGFLEKWLIPEYGQGLQKISLEDLVIQESKKAISDHQAGVKILPCNFSIVSSPQLHQGKGQCSPTMQYKSAKVKSQGSLWGQPGKGNDSLAPVSMSFSQ